MSLATDIADAVAAELNAADAGTFSQAFTARWKVLPASSLTELTDLCVSVVPKSVLTENGSRAAAVITVSIDIGVQKKLGTDIDTEVATLGTLVDEIASYLRRRDLAEAAYASWAGSTNEPVYAPDHLTQDHVFTSVLTVSYQVLVR